VLSFVTPQLTTEFFPYVDKDLFYIDIKSELPGNIEATEKLSDQVVDILSSEPEISSYTVAIGDGMPKFYITMRPATPSKDFAQMLIKFDLGDEKDRRFHSRDEFATYIQDLLDKKITAGKCTVNRLQNAEPQDAKIIIRVSGSNVERVDEFTRQLTDKVREVEGTLNVRNNLKPYTFQFEIDVDSDKASSMGMTKYDIQKQMNLALYGYDASVYRRDGKEYNIVVQGNIEDTTDIETFMIKSSLTENKIPMHSYSEVNLGKKLDNINRYDR
ncbi:Acriflavin resistance protein like protein, partial [Aduncisulcus paluster]